ncbi:MAG: hypothetical protein V4640_07190 [Verrucomicrobiota bacterium]
MKKHLTLTAGAGLFLAALMLAGGKFTASPTPAEPASIAAGSHKKARPQPVAISPEQAAPIEVDPASLQSVHEETANLSQWQNRLNGLVTELGSDDAAQTALLAEMDAAYSSWVQQEITDLAEQSPADRYDRLAEIDTELRDGVASILASLGIADDSASPVAAAAMDVIAAETQYAEMAPHPESRLALLRLDREREIRLEQALAIHDEAAQAQAMAEVDGWYDSGLGSLFTVTAP